MSATQCNVLPDRMSVKKPIDAVATHKFFFPFSFFFFFLSPDRIFYVYIYVYIHFYIRRIPPVYIRSIKECIGSKRSKAWSIEHREGTCGLQTVDCPLSLYSTYCNVKVYEKKEEKQTSATSRYSLQIHISCTCGSNEVSIACKSDIFAD